MMIDETIAATILTYQEMYIYGRMKVVVCGSKRVPDSLRSKDFGHYCVNRCVDEIRDLVTQVPEDELMELLNFNNYADFDESLRDIDIEEYYHGFDSIDFATYYDKYLEEFNSYVKEYV